jgi:hypothetical protein
VELSSRTGTTPHPTSSSFINTTDFSFYIPPSPFTFLPYPHSPLSDLLDSNRFTLEEILREDELIQEVKVKNDRLLEL